MNQFKEIERNGWTLKCPSCSHEVLYTKIKNWDIPTLFFYGETSNDVLLRKSDTANVREKMTKETLDFPALEILWNEILNTAPDCPTGGKFSFWANVHCPNCRQEFPYNQGVRNVAIRINEPEIILIDGAIVIGDNSSDSWKVKVILG